MMKKIYGLILVSFFLIAACHKESGFDFPLIYTGQVSNITPQGVDFNARLANIRLDQIKAYGFVWDTLPNPTIGNSEKYVIGKSPESEIIQQHISTALIAGMKYYARAFVQEKKLVVYGKDITFVSLGSGAPKISGISPQSGNLGDRLTITGENFSYRKENNIVRIGTERAKILSASQDTLVVLIPDILAVQSAPVNVSIYNKQATAANHFNLIPPVIRSLDPDTATFGSRILIRGDNFTANPSSVKVYFDNIKVVSQIKNQKSIDVLVPNDLKKSKYVVKVFMNNLFCQSEDTFRISRPLITDISPKSASTGGKLIIKGKNFSPAGLNNSVFIGGMKANIYWGSQTDSTLTVYIPYQNEGYYPSRDVKIEVKVNDQSAEYNGTLHLNDTWFRLKNSPVNFTGAFYEEVNGKIYLGINNNIGFWEYDPATDTFKRLANFPGKIRTGGKGFVENGTIYFGTGLSDSTYLKDFWQYDISLNTWRRLNDFSGSPRAGGFGFTVDGNGYLGGGAYDSLGTMVNHADFWKYNVATDTWLRVSDLLSTNPSWPGISYGTYAVVGDKVYLGLGVGTLPDFGRWYCYDPKTDQWNAIAIFPYTRWEGNNRLPSAFVLNGVMYAKTISSVFCSYNSQNDSWSTVSTGMLPVFNSPVSVGIGNKAYFFYREVYYGSNSDEVWVYTPGN
ncbi:MAG: IPT/TIG domain-containing protein [Bacteroidales bacterium]|nr:IPT/TIG domain-containing protein [Bacteroidales bacterium]